jgi:ATP-dependent protease ClpP protease subunit
MSMLFRTDSGGGRPLIHAKLKPFFRAQLHPDGALEIAIYEDIGESWWDGGGVTAKTIKEQLDQDPTYEKILLRINSPGGDAFEGIAIYNLIRAQNKPVEVCIDGVAASSAAIIAMAGDTITMGPNAMMMVHNASGFCAGEALDMRSMADALDKISTAIAQTFVARTGKSLGEIQALMNAETWMTAQECLAEGFATQITEPGPIEQSALAMARRFKALAKLKRVPAQLRAKDATECACECESCEAGDCPNCTNPDCMDENCTDCPMQSAGADSSNNLSLFEARAKLLLRGSAA